MRILNSCVQFLCSGVDVSLSLCNTQARAVNLIHAVICDDERVTQARGC